MKNQRYNAWASYITLLFLLFSTTSAYANEPHWESSYYNSSVRIDIVDDKGRYLRKYPTSNHNANTQREYLEAVKGKRYQLRIRNTSNRRVGVVVAVDGRNILTGKKSYLRSNEKMYVLNPHETANYKGWRTSKNRVNRFYFTTAGGSYSNAWGDRSAMGVIAVAVYDEKRKRRHYKKYNNNNLSGRAAPSRRSYDESTGTGFGREEYSPTVNVYFKPNNRPSHKYFYKYEWRSTLCKRGIIRCRPYNNPRNNNRFWPEDNSGYAPYPPDYYLNDENNFNVVW